MAKSKYGKLNKSDFWKGLLVSMGTGVAMAIQQWVSIGDYHKIDYKMLAMAAVGAACVYWIKNLGENSNGQLFKKEETSKYDRLKDKL